MSYEYLNYQPACAGLGQRDGRPHDPDKTIWIDGSEGQLRALREQAFATGELEELNQEKLPGCVLHHTAKNDVARVEDRTFICTSNKADECAMVNWMDPNEMKAKLLPLYTGVMKGRTMYVIPYCMGPIGSPFSKVGIEVTDSIYVVLNMDIMTRVGVKALRQLGDSNDFVRGQHARADIDPENRYIVQFPEDNAIWSINSGYGGNVLLGKKCFAPADCLLSGLQRGLDGRAHADPRPRGSHRPHRPIITAAFPSACGKTNLAMLIPPRSTPRRAIRSGPSATTSPGCTSARTAAVRDQPGERLLRRRARHQREVQPQALHTTMKGTIFTNVAHNLADNTVWWEGLDKNPPEDVQEWTGLAVDGKKYVAEGGKLAHPNSRFTAPAVNCPCLSKEFNNPAGVPVTAMIFGGRRAKTAPLVYQSFSWNHGVYVGSSMASETTAAAAGAVGVVRRDPMAMRPFFGYNVGDYFAHWIEMGRRLGDKAPKIFHVNWFRTDDEGHFIWPGFGDNMRVLMWILKRCKGEVDAVETPIGYLPKPEDIDITGLDGITLDTIKGLLTVDKDLWMEDANGVEELYNQIGDHVPAELRAELAALKERLSK